MRTKNPPNIQSPSNEFQPICMVGKENNTFDVLRYCDRPHFHCYSDLLEQREDSALQCTAYHAKPAISSTSPLIYTKY